MERSKEYFELWAQGILMASKAENIYIKISGLGMGDNNWTIDSIRPYVLHCIDSFGTNRVIFATNWPIDSLWSSYENVVDSYVEIIQDFSSDEKVTMFSTNTKNLYGI
jgi:predicted TIM-barrel fold metal-dependent hydrolase